MSEWLKEFPGEPGWYFTRRLLRSGKYTETRPLKLKYEEDTASERPKLDLCYEEWNESTMKYHWYILSDGFEFVGPIQLPPS